MVNDMALALLKTDLGFTGALPSEIEAYMKQRLEAASARLEGMGLELDESKPEHLDLLVMFAAYLYRKRNTGEGLPPMVRLAINDCKVAAALEVRNDL